MATISTLLFVVDRSTRGLRDTQSDPARPRPAVRCRRTNGVPRRTQQFAGITVGAHRLESALRASEKRGAHRGAQDEIVRARDELRFIPRSTRDPLDSLLPIAMSEWPEISGAMSGISAFRSVDRSTSQ